MPTGGKEKAMAPHSSTLAWKIPWMEEPGRLQSMGSLRVGYDWASSLSFSLSCIGEGNGNPLHCSCLENPRDGGAWWAAVYGVAQSRTRLKRLSSSSTGGKSLNKKIQKDQNLTKTRCWEQKQGTAHALCYSTTRSGQITYLSNPITGPTCTPQ